MKSSQEHDKHYRDMVIEPMHRSLENNLDAAQHTICKYVERHKVKNGVRDLEAARDLLIDYLDYVKYGTWKGKRMTTHESVGLSLEDAESLCAMRKYHRFETGSPFACLDCAHTLASISPS